MNDGGVAAMNKLAAFRQEASVGARVTLRLTRGEDVSGRVAQLDDAYVRLDLEGRTVTIFAEICRAILERYEQWKSADRPRR